MPVQKEENPQTALINAEIYLLEVRLEQLSDALWEPSHRGDPDWTQRLRNEEDQVSLFLQKLRTQQARIAETAREKISEKGEKIVN